MFLNVRSNVKKCSSTLVQEENRDQMIKMPVEIFPECPYPADVHYVDLPEVYKARVQQTHGTTYQPVGARTRRTILLIRNLSNVEFCKVMRRFERLFNALEVASQEHFDMIRTSLGHPENQEELTILEKKERERQFKSSKV